MKHIQSKTGSGFEAGGQYQDYNFYGIADRSTSDVVSDATDLDTRSLAIVYIVLVLYVAMGLLGWRGNVSSHSVLGICGVVVIALAVIAAMGLGAWLELGWTPLSWNVMPFICLGIGIDDMLVITHAYARKLKKYHNQYAKLGVSSLLGDVLYDTGASVVFTTITNFIAFMVASTIPIYVVQLFCQLMAIGIVMNFVFLMLLFIPILSVDAARTLSEYPEHCCLGHTCSEAHDDEEYESPITKLFHRYYGPFLMRKPVMAFALIAGFLFFALQLWQGLSEADVGIRNSDVTTDNTYQNDFFVANERDFAYYNSQIVQRSNQFEKQSVQVAMQMAAKNSILTKFVEESEMGVGTGASWVQSVADVAPVDSCESNEVNVTSRADNYCNLDVEGADSTTTTYVYTPEANFYKALSSYFGGLGSLRAASFVCRNRDTDEIVSCFELTKEGVTNVYLNVVQETVYNYNQTTTDQILDLLEDFRDQVDPCLDAYEDGLLDPEGDSASQADGDTTWVYPSGYLFKFFAQYLHTEQNLRDAVIYTALGIFGVALFFTFSWRSSLILSVVIIKTVIELIGIIPESDISLENGLKLNAFSLVNLCVSVGMAVEFTAHIVHRYLDDRGSGKEGLEGRCDRVINALGYMGPPIVHGGVTSLIASAFLAMSDVAMVC